MRNRGHLDAKFKLYWNRGLSKTRNLFREILFFTNFTLILTLTPILNLLPQF